jgi:phytoene dehydrogenase-like protein
VGSGPNGLAAAIRLAQAGVRVTVLEAKETIGGGTRTQELTLPGFQHDVCSAIHPLGAGSPFFRTLPLAEHGLEWIHPEVALAHPFDDGTATTLKRSLGETAADMGADAAPYKKLFRPISERWRELSPAILGPVIRPPRHPLSLARFGMLALRSATDLAEGSFSQPTTRALFMGIAAHGNVRLDRRFTAGVGLILGAAAHVAGWPMARGGSQAIAEALAGCLRSLGGEIVLGQAVRSLADIPQADGVLFDLTPRQIVSIAGTHLTQGYRRSMGKFRYGAGVFKVDYALAGPIPWRADACRRAGTVHLGGSMEEVVASEQSVALGRAHDRPFVILAQQSLFDPSRAPSGNHTAWAYCHVPNGWTGDMTEVIEAQIERFAPGFGSLVLARHTLGPASLEQYNENYVGGDIAAGAAEGLQLFLRPAARISPYTTSDKHLFICSASTPPGAGVHGMCGYYAAEAALQRI